MFCLIAGFFFTILLGYLLSFTLMNSMSSGERVALSPVFGFGTVSFILFFLFLFQFLINEIQLLSVLAGLCFTLIVIYRKELFFIESTAKPGRSFVKTDCYLLWCVVLLLFGFSFFFSSAYPVFITDGNDYEATGRLIALNGALKQEYFFRSQPPFVPLAYSFIYILGGAHPKIIFSLFYISLIGLLYISLKRETRSQRDALMFATLMASTPFLWWHSYLGLLNLTAGYFFVVGCLYLIRCLKSQENIGEAAIAGIGFGLASFTRLEYLVYFFTPYLIFLLFGNRKFRQMLAFSIPALLPVTLWSIFKEVSFIGGEGIYTAEEPLTILAFWMITIFSIAAKYIGTLFPDLLKRQRVKRVLLFGLLVFFVGAGIFFIQSRIPFSPSASALKIIIQTGACITFRLLAGNIFWMFTSLAFVLIFLKPFRETFKGDRVIFTAILIGSYYLLHVIVHTYHTYSHDPAGTHPYHVSMIANLKWVFLAPGNFFNTSEVRDLLAINPLLIFLCGQVCCAAKIREKGRILLSRFLIAIMCLNLITLSVIFLYPRLAFLYEHRNSSAREVLLSPGPRDNPNMKHLRKIYALMYFVKDHSEVESAVYFIDPQFSKPEALKILLPRRVKFVDLLESSTLFDVGQKTDGARSYLVLRNETIPDFVEKEEVIWNEEGWGIYRIR